MKIPLRKFKIAAAVASIGLATAVANPGIGAAEPIQQDGSVVIINENGGEAGWVSMDAIDNRFDTLTPTAQAAAAKALNAGDSQARSASGCNNEVCIAVSGEDLVVVEWATTAVQVGSMNCQEAYFSYPNGTYVGDYICPVEPDGVFYDATGPIGAFDDNTQLCNSWSDSGGRPCITVHD